MIVLLLKLLLVTAVCCAPGKGVELDLPPVASERLLQGWIGPEALLFRLDKLLDVCIANYEDLSQVKSILSTSNPKNRAFIESLQRKCDYVESRIDSIFTFPSAANAIVSKLLINSNFWQSFDDVDDIPLRLPDPESMNHRHMCLSELLVNDSENEFNASLSRAGKEPPLFKPLLLSQGCSAAMSMRKKSFGYHLTHKLLFYLILGKQRFSNIEEDYVANAKGRLCEQILRESRLIAELNFPEMFRDLFMEQVFLCSYAGFVEFRNQSWISEVVGWQNANGCFKYYYQDGVEQYDGDSAIRAVCSTHMSGVGAALLGLFAKLQF
ncbi:hypothetical protein pipiens_005945 [Culex pipiens pipiens]|uniref:Uncharacterized protein n=1 Tax=Culex pipiens pipiens TaxID=38569 RepID=A0ABD1DSI9_CULPP